MVPPQKKQEEGEQCFPLSDLLAAQQIKIKTKSTQNEWCRIRTRVFYEIFIVEISVPLTLQHINAVMYCIRNKLDMYHKHLVDRNMTKWWIKCIVKQSKPFCTNLHPHTGTHSWGKLGALLTRMAVQKYSNTAVVVVRWGKIQLCQQAGIQKKLVIC